MAEKLPRRKKTPEHEHNPELERLIDQAPKGSVSKIKQEIQSEQPEEISESLSEAELQSLLDATVSGRPRLKDFKDILDKARANGNRDIFHDRIEKIGKAAAKRLGGSEYNAFKEFLAEKYELNDPDVITETPELDFLRSKEYKIPREPKIGLEKPAIEMADKTKKSPEENIVAASPEIQEVVPENLPGRSPEELKDFANIFSADEQGKNNTLSQESTEGLPGRDKDGKFNAELIRQAIKAKQSVEVKLRRSSGDIEGGWFLRDGDRQHVVAAKYVGNGRTITKIVLLEEVNDLNRIESHPVPVPEVSIPTKKEPTIDSVPAQNVPQRSEELNHEAAGHASGYARKGEEIQAEVLAPEAELKNLERAEKPTEGAPAPEEKMAQMTSEGAFFTPEQKKYLSELDVPMPAEERNGTWKPTTRAEWVEELRSLVLGEKNSERKGKLYGAKESLKMSERYEKSKEYITKRSEELGDMVKEYGPAFVGYVGSKIEQYNKLNWKTKLALTGALMAGTAFSGGVLATGFAAALWGQRLIGVIGMGMNKRKKLDAEIAANPEHRLAGKSESRKNIEVALWSAAYMAATSFAVHEGVEGLKAVADSEWIQTPGEWLGNTREWLGKMLEHDSIQSSGDAVETLVPTPDTSSVEVPSDQVHTVQTLDPTLFAEAKGDDQLRILAENSLKHLTPNEQAVLDNHIASFTPRERYFFDQFTTEYSNKINAPETPLYDPEVDAHIAKAREAIERMQALVDEQAKILNTMPDGSEALSPDLPGPESAVATPEQSPAVSEADTMPGAEEGPVEVNPEPKVEGGDSPAPEQDMLETPLPPEQAADAPFGYDPIDGHPMNEMEAQKLADLRNAMHDPRETGAWPPGHPKEEGFFEKFFGSSDENTTETVDQFNIDSVSATETHVYADAEGHLFAHGGSIEEKIETIQKFLTENPDKIVYGTDDSGNYRIPWSLYEGHALPGEPVRTGGFLGFFSSFMDAPRPEEFVKKIK